MTRDTKRIRPRRSSVTITFRELATPDGRDRTVDRLRDFGAEERTIGVVRHLSGLLGVAERKIAKFDQERVAVALDREKLVDRVAALEAALRSAADTLESVTAELAMRGAAQPVTEALRVLVETYRDVLEGRI
jgi:hypothetical protein